MRVRTESSMAWFTRAEAGGSVSSMDHEETLPDGTVTVSDVVKARDFKEHANLGRKWGESVWKVWKDKHYAIITGLADQAINSRG